MHDGQPQAFQFVQSVGPPGEQSSRHGSTVHEVAPSTLMWCVLWQNSSQFWHEPPGQSPAHDSPSSKPPSQKLLPPCPVMKNRP